MAVSPDLLRAYEDADYVVFLEQELVLKIGEPSPRLDALMQEAEVSCAAFVTACNPHSKRQDEAANRAATEALEGLVRQAGYPHHRAEGREPDGSWREPGLLILGIVRANAEALGRLFGQNAIVFMEKGALPQLAAL